jgi:hypothetical protein
MALGNVDKESSLVTTMALGNVDKESSLVKHVGMALITSFNRFSFDYRVVIVPLFPSKI